MGTPIGCVRQELSLGTDSLEKEHELELEEQRPEGTRIDRRPPARRIAVCDEVTHKAQVHRALKMAIDVVNWDELLQCSGLDRMKDT